MKTLFLFISLITFSSVYSQDTLFFNTMERGDSSCTCKTDVIIDKTDSTEVLFEFNINGDVFHIVCETSDFVNYKADENDLSINRINITLGKMGPFITITYDKDKPDMFLYNSNKWFK